MEKRLSDYNLLRISLGIGILGLGVLICLSLFMPKSEFLDYYNKEGKIRISGDIVKMDIKENYTFMKVRYDCIIDTMVFENVTKNMIIDDVKINISKLNISRINGSRIIVEGNIQEYKGKKSLVADKIDILSVMSEDKYE